MERANNAGKISPELINTLETLISDMEKGILSNKDSNEERSTFSLSKGAKKYQSQKNVEKVAVPPKEVV